MASERAHLALRMRRNGATYVEIGECLEVGSPRARQLVFVAIREELGPRASLQAQSNAFDSIKYLGRKGHSGR